MGVCILIAFHALPFAITARRSKSSRLTTQSLLLEASSSCLEPLDPAKSARESGKAGRGATIELVGEGVHAAEKKAERGRGGIMPFATVSTFALMSSQLRECDLWLTTFGLSGKLRQTVQQEFACSLLHA
jgi:hypothetical protein